ncbi:MAG: DEAD/DEAH box helicase [Desulfobacterium sp.]|nr:DEAD/DEAH box helicase [Desulfobacterium sp.]
MSSESLPHPGFSEMGLIKPVLKALDDLGYESPTAIQAQIIPHVHQGRDVLGQAQTGTGKTAAFALPLLSRIDIKLKKPQVLVLAPTRELAIQVAESFKGYAARIKGFNVLPIYGGQAYGGQLNQLKRGVHVIVGTPGRLMDLMKRGALSLDSLTTLVIDEADEMLRMGFIDDVEWILKQTPDKRQIALFSATMPAVIKKIAIKYLNDPQEVTIKLRTATADTIHQRFWMVKGTHKLDALTRILEAEVFDAIIVFVRTKTATVEIAEKLEARGYSAEALNGDIAQKSRERTINRFKSGKIDILVATDVAARGLDVDRVSHVINYDIPNEAESYVHRIGRTGRAGRKGDAILFVSPRERWMLRVIEKTTRQKIEMMRLPTTEAINDKRIADFKQSITDTLSSTDLGPYFDLMDQYRQEQDVPALEIAAALAMMVQGNKPLLLSVPKPAYKKPVPQPKKDYENGPVKGKESFRSDSKTEKKAAPKKEYGNGPGKGKESFQPDSETDKSTAPKKDVAKKQPSSPPPKGMERFRIEVGRTHGVRPKDIVGAIANEAELDSKFIGTITIEEDHSLVDLPLGMPSTILQLLKKVWVAGQPMKLSRSTSKGQA